LNEPKKLNLLIIDNGESISRCILRFTIFYKGIFVKIFKIITIIDDCIIDFDVS